jgi:hypothetical protein
VAIILLLEEESVVPPQAASRLVERPAMSPLIMVRFMSSPGFLNWQNFPSGSYGSFMGKFLFFCAEMQRKRQWTSADALSSFLALQGNVYFEKSMLRYSKARPAETTGSHSQRQVAAACISFVQKRLRMPT